MPMSINAITTSSGDKAFIPCVVLREEIFIEALKLNRPIYPYPPTLFSPQPLNKTRQAPTTLRIAPRRSLPFAVRLVSDGDILRRLFVRSVIDEWPTQHFLDLEVRQSVEGRAMEPFSVLYWHRPTIAQLLTRKVQGPPGAPPGNVEAQRHLASSDGIDRPAVQFAQRTPRRRRASPVAARLSNASHYSRDSPAMSRRRAPSSSRSKVALQRLHFLIQDLYPSPQAHAKADVRR